MFPAIFLDRDGVIIQNQPDYVRSWADVCIYPQALKALARIAASPYKIVIITNQAGIGHGLIPPKTADEINLRLVQEIQAAGGRVDLLKMCPHRPQENCACRKPQPGMILEAARELNLDLARSYLIGDAISDLQAAQSAGVGRYVLVRTGRGEEQARSPEASHLAPFPIYADLDEALRCLFERTS